MEKAAVNPSFFGKLVPFGNGEAKRMEGALLANQKVKKMLNSGVDDAFASLQDLSKNRINEVSELVSSLHISPKTNPQLRLSSPPRPPPNQKDQDQNQNKTQNKI